jgi:hypothetical protein
MEEFFEGLLGCFFWFMIFILSTIIIYTIIRGIVLILGLLGLGFIAWVAGFIIGKIISAIIN